MLIECKQCGAPLDVKPGQQVAKCRYCSASSQLAETRMVAQYTPPAWKPPPQWTPPAHVPADSSKPLSLQTDYLIHQIGGLLVTLAIGGVLAAVALIAIVSEFRSDPKVEIRASSGTTAGVVSTGQSNEQRAAGLFGAKALEKLHARFEKKLGAPVRLVELTIHKEHASLTAQSADNVKDLDRYSYRGGKVTKDRPVPRARYRGPLDKHLFELGHVPFERFGAFIEQAQAKLGFDQGKPSHIMVEKKSGTEDQVEIRVYIRSERENGYVEFDGQGNVIRTSK